MFKIDKDDPNTSSKVFPVFKVVKRADNSQHSSSPESS